VPTRVGDAFAGVSCDGLAVGRNCRRAVDDKAARGVVKGENKGLLARRQAENVRHRKRRWRRESRGTRRLNGDIESVLQHARRQHVFDERGRHGADADLRIGERITIGVENAAGLDGERQLLALGVGERDGRSRGRVLWHRDGGRRGVAHVL
jgi:hypothetical protein